MPNSSLYSRKKIIKIKVGILVWVVKIILHLYKAKNKERKKERKKERTNERTKERKAKNKERNKKKERKKERKKKENNINFARIGNYIFSLLEKRLV